MLTANNQPVYTIGIAAKLLGVCTATLRLWEKKGVIRPHRLGKNRFYSQCNVERLKEIKRLLQEEGLNIAGVKNILNSWLCWEIKKCTLQERQNCPVYKQHRLFDEACVF